MIQSKNPRVIIGFFGALIILFIIGNIISTRYWRKEYAKYPRIEKETVIEKKIRRVRKEHGTLLIDFYDTTKYSTYVLTRNFEYEDYDLFFLVENGDSILKKMNSDTLIVKRKGVEYLFVLGQVLNKHLDK